jgi:hypothetical protein
LIRRRKRVFGGSLKREGDPVTSRQNLRSPKKTPKDKNSKKKIKKIKKRREKRKKEKREPRRNIPPSGPAAADDDYAPEMRPRWKTPK